MRVQDQPTSYTFVQNRRDSVHSAATNVKDNVTILMGVEALHGGDLVLLRRGTTTIDNP